MLETPYLITESYTDKVSLIFNKFGDDDVTGYIVYGGQNPENLTVIDTTDKTWLNLTELENHSRYYFKVAALNSTGEESGLSNQEEIFVKYVDPGENIILNGDFSVNDEYWDLEISDGVLAMGDIVNGQYFLYIILGGTKYEDAQLMQTGIQLIQGKQYLLEFDGRTDNSRLMEPKIEKSISPFDNYSKIGYMFLTSESKHFTFTFNMEDISDLNARLVFNIGASTEDVYIDNVSLKEVVTSDVQTHVNRIPDDYQLYNNYPNPFNPVTMINYQLPMTNDVELSIYNLIGQKVATLKNEQQHAGYYQVEWDASGNASGIYYYRMEARTLTGKINYIETRKMMILK